jgi:trk/ktr system potassium uptake protein
MKKKPKKQQVLVVGLGRFGQSLARSLVKDGFEVMALDSCESAADEVAGEVTHVMIADSTEENVLREIGPEHFDLVVCAIGGDIQASIMTVLLLKELGAKYLVAKASTAIHGRALTKMGVDRVVFPEREMAERLAQDFLTPQLTELLRVSVSYSMFEIPAPETFVGKSLIELNLRERFGMNVLAIKRNGDAEVSPAPTQTILSGDSLLVLGNRERASKCLDAED